MPGPPFGGVNPIRVKITGDLSDPRSIEIVDEHGAKVTNVLSFDIHASRVPSECSITLQLWGGVQLDVEGVAEVEHE